jgi:hypothetical protein
MTVPKIGDWLEYPSSAVPFPLLALRNQASVNVSLSVCLAMSVSKW